MFKWMVLTLPTEGYTEDGCGEPTTNPQFISIIDALTPEEAFVLLQKQNPNLFAYDIEFDALRWSGFNFVNVFKPTIDNIIYIDKPK